MHHLESSRVTGSSHSLQPRLAHERMKIRGKSVVIALALMMLAVGSRAQDVEPLAIGSALPLGSAQLQTTTGEPITLSGQRGEKGLLVVFTCNTCPWVAKWEDRYVTVAKLASELGVGFVALNANEAQRSGEEGPRQRAISCPAA